MNYRALFFATVVLGALSADNAFAMVLDDCSKTNALLTDNRFFLQQVNGLPKSNEVTIIDKGLLTVITAVIAQTKHFQGMGRGIIDTRIVKGSVLNLMNYPSKIPSGDVLGELFCPRVLKLTGDKIEDLGIFQPFKHKELKEVIRSCPRQALYCAEKQGVFVYSLNAHFRLPLSKDETFSYSNNANMIIGGSMNIEQYMENQIHNMIVLSEKNKK